MESNDNKSDPVQEVNPPSYAIGTRRKLPNEGGIAGDIGYHPWENDHTGQDIGGVRVIANSKPGQLGHGHSIGEGQLYVRGGVAICEGGRSGTAGEREEHNI